MYLKNIAKKNNNKDYYIIFGKEKPKNSLIFLDDKYYPFLEAQPH